ncbi:MAG TPA: hypothetical protein VFI73_02645 [Candidatus Nitrosopolaris sp.]|nr:hypothetical protein [Candidatus Nitrosopolaris sp.]
MPKHLNCSFPVELVTEDVTEVPLMEASAGSSGNVKMGNVGIIVMIVPRQILF